MMCNTWKNTFHGVCGPFIFKNDRWFPVYAKKYQDTVKLAQENSELRKKIEELEKKLRCQ
jgi:methionine salvage enolase-phosphatase E1